MSESSHVHDDDGARGPGSSALRGLLYIAYPRWFLDEFGAELRQHLALQREEARYRERTLGGARFWWDVVSNTLATGATLRLGRLRERLSDVWYGPRNGALRNGAHGSRRGGVQIMIEAVLRDVRHATRTLVRSPGYALIFVTTLGLGIGANTAMFSAVNGVLLRPLPHEHGEQLVYLRQSALRAGDENATFSVPEINDYRAATKSLSAIAEFSAMSFTLLGHEAPRRVRAGIVSGNYFAVMGLSATLGRTIGAEDAGADAASVMVLTDRYWRSAFGGDPDIVGRTLIIDGTSATIVGVAEPAPPYPERTDIYVNMATSPHHLDAAMNHDRRHRMTEVFARLAPGGTLASVDAELAAVSERMRAQYPEAYDASAGFTVSVTPLKSQLTTRARSTFLLLLGTAFLVLIIACANLANLALTRVIRREHELAVRVSLGASRGALRRELLMENLMLAVIGAALGVLIAFISLDLIVTYAERFTVRATEITLDATVLAFALASALAASIFFTLLPALPESDRIHGALRSGSRTTVGAVARRAQRALVVAQVGTSFVLLIGAGLLMRTMMFLNRVDPGFDTSPILSMDVPWNSVLPPTDDASRNRYAAMLEAVRAVPGVAGAALAGAVPLAANSAPLMVPISIERLQPAPGAPTPRASFRVVSADYFSLLGIDIVRGREFVSTDIEAAQPVVVINESMARHYFGERDPVGQRIAWQDPLMARYGGVTPEWRTVVGVVADTRERNLEAEIPHTVYTPFPQLRLVSALVARVNGDAAPVIESIRKVILAQNPNQPIENVATLEDLSDRSVAPRRLNATLLGAFALLALVIAAVGIGGVLAFSVSGRTREFGVRSALGAARHQIWSTVITEGALLAGIGVALGTVAALALTRFIAGLLVGVQALDPVTFIAVGVLLGAVAIGAAWLPAWRAAAVSPVQALAAE